MYAHHNPPIAAGMRESPAIFKRGCVFVILSIRQRIDLVPGQMAEVDAERAEAACLFGWKRSAYRHIEVHGERLWRSVCAVPLKQPATAIRILLEVPGLGLVKAAFVAQLMGFDVACLDSRNGEREGRDYAREFKLDKGAPAATRTRKLRRYVAKVRGRAQEYWDAWCEFVALDYGLTADAVSAIHLEILPEGFIPF